MDGKCWNLFSLYLDKIGYLVEVHHAVGITLLSGNKHIFGELEGRGAESFYPIQKRLVISIFCIFGSS